MGQKTSRELTAAPRKKVLPGAKEESYEDFHSQPSPKFPESLQMRTPLPSLLLRSKTNEGMRESSPSEALKEPISQLLPGSSTANKAQVLLARVNLSHRCEDIQNNRTKRCWTDEDGNHCVVLFARALQITWIEDEQFWAWSTVRENDIDIEVAKLLDVCWLEIHGRLHISDINPGVKYEVVFMVMMEPGRYGWSVPVNLRLKLPQGAAQQHTEDLQRMALSHWTELKAGEFTVDANESSGDSEIEFSLFDYKGGLWKRGLVVKGAIIRPKKENSIMTK